MQTQSNEYDVFPYPGNEQRLSNYDYFEKLFLGEHFDAFRMKIDTKKYNEAYAKLRYVAVNFAGLVSKVCADMLFSEAPQFKSETNQDFIDALILDNKLKIQNYESALSNSYNGDALFKLRVGKRLPTDTQSTIIIEDITPKIYFPHINEFNVRDLPDYQELAWTFTRNKRQYLRIERHKPGTIENEVWLMNGNKLAAKEDIAMLGIEGLKDIEETKVDNSLLIHIPNWKAGNRWNGISDYYDIDQLIYALNNRISKVDNILDKHSDPILMVPEGILDEKGRVKKGSLGVIEMKEGETGKPEYIVWDASLENAFKEIEKLVEFLFMTSETSPDAFGMGQGQSDSGRALKLKLLRTLAKVQRKRLYYDDGLKQVFLVAQKLALAHNVTVRGVKCVDAKDIDIKWMDGLPIDESEQVDTEVKRVDAGLTTVTDSLMRIDGLDEKSAKKKAKEIDDENKIAMPTPTPGANPFAKKPDNGMMPMDGKNSNMPMQPPQK